MGCFLLSLHKIVSQVLQAWCTLALLELHWWRMPGPTSLAELYKGCALTFLMARGSPWWMLFLQTSLYQRKKGEISTPVCRKNWKSPFSHSALWMKQAESCCEESPTVSAQLSEALLQEETPFLSKEQGARAERQVPSCLSGKTSRAVRRRRRRVWERQRLACDLGVKESTVGQDQ